MVRTDTIYSDINIDNYWEQPVLYDFAAVNQAFSTILETRKGERLAQPTLGVNYDYFFELIDSEALEIALRRDLFEEIPAQDMRLSINYVRSNISAIPDMSTVLLDLSCRVSGLGEYEYNKILGEFKS